MEFSTVSSTLQYLRRHHDGASPASRCRDDVPQGLLLCVLAFRGGGEGGERISNLSPPSDGIRNHTRSDASYKQHIQEQPFNANRIPAKIE